MEGEKRERWMRLCVEVADEQDSNRLLESISEIDRLLREKELRLRNVRLTHSPLASAHLVELPSLILCQRLGSGRCSKSCSELLIGDFPLLLSYRTNRACQSHPGEKADLPLPDARLAKQAVKSIITARPERADALRCPNR
jgi:hypothetical protein